MGKIEIKTKRLSKKKAREILHKLYDLTKDVRKSEIEEFISIEEKGFSLGI